MPTDLTALPSICFQAWPSQCQMKPSRLTAHVAIGCSERTRHSPELQRQNKRTSNADVMSCSRHSFPFSAAPPIDLNALGVDANHEATAACRDLACFATLALPRAS